MEVLLCYQLSPLESTGHQGSCFLWMYTGDCSLLFVRCYGRAYDNRYIYSIGSKALLPILDSGTLVVLREA